MNDIALRFIQPGNPQRNAYIEGCNGTVRYAWLISKLFTTSPKRKTLLRSGYGLTTTSRRNGARWHLSDVGARQAYA